MRLTTERLKKLIREELNRLNENAEHDRLVKEWESSINIDDKVQELMNNYFFDAQKGMSFPENAIKAVAEEIIEDMDLEPELQQGLEQAVSKSNLIKELIAAQNKYDG